MLLKFWRVGKEAVRGGLKAEVRETKSFEHALVRGPEGGEGNKFENSSIVHDIGHQEMLMFQKK